MTTFSFKYVILTLVLAISAFGCDSKEGQTVETAYIDPRTLPVIYRYEFSRNGISNVDLLEVSIMQETISRIINDLSRASLTNEEAFNEWQIYYTEGRFGEQPQSQVATSQLHKHQQKTILEDLNTLVEASKNISGYYLQYPNKDTNKTRPASKGVSGYLLDGKTRLYANEKGLVLSEAFTNMLLGAIFLDKILNIHLDEYILDDPNLRLDHENVVLPAGKNYTTLEHHWDLAYGYFHTFWRTLAQPEGIVVLRGVEENLNTAFVLGRTELSRYRYADMKKHISVIRTELSKVVAIRAVHYLLNTNTIANLKENTGSNAFSSLSTAYGLIYATQFARKSNGEPYISYQKAMEYNEILLSGKGFWEKDRLLAGISEQNSLLYIADEIGKIFGFSINEVQR